MMASLTASTSTARALAFSSQTKGHVSRPRVACRFQTQSSNLTAASTKPTTVAAHAQTPKPKPRGKAHSFFYFDPESQEVIEVKASGASSVDEVQAAVIGAAPSTSTFSPPPNEPINNIVRFEEVSTSSSSSALSKSSALQTELLSQLERERSRVNELLMVEARYKEWRMKAQAASVELTTLKGALADKDEELALAYKRLESAAAERSALRKLSSSLELETLSLQAAAEEGELLGAKAIASGTGSNGTGSAW